MTDPTPIAADTHVSGGVEVRVVDTAASWLYESVFPRMGGWSAVSPENKSAWRERAATVTRLAATPVPANAEGIVAWRERDGDEWAYYDADSDTGQHIAAYQKDRHGASVFPLYATLTTRPTDTAAREAAVEAAVIERCAKVAWRQTARIWDADEAVAHATGVKACQERRAQWGDDDCDRDGSCEECQHDIAVEHETEASRIRRETAERIYAAIRTLAPAHIADATEGDTAARDEGMVREVMMVINDMRRAGGAANVWADRVQDALEGDAA